MILGLGFGLQSLTSGDSGASGLRIIGFGFRTLGLRVYGLGVLLRQCSCLELGMSTV